MQNPEEQIKELLQRLTPHVGRVGTKVEIYKYLQDCIRDERLKAIDIAPAFFNNTRDALFTDIIVTLHKLYDSRKSAKRSLVHYLRQVREHFRSLNIARSDFTSSTIDEQLVMIYQANDKLDRISRHRDQFRAHHDEKYFDHPEKLYEDAPLNLDDLSKLVEIAREILFIHHGAMMNVHYIMRTVNAHDVDNVIKSIQRYQVLMQHQECVNILFPKPNRA